MNEPRIGFSQSLHACDTPPAARSPAWCRDGSLLPQTDRSQGHALYAHRSFRRNLATAMQGTNQNHLAIADATASRMHSHLEPGVDEPLIRMKSTWAATHAENSSRQHAHEDERRSHHQLQSSRLWCPLAGGRQTSDDRHILAVTNVARSEATAGDRLAAKHSTSARRFL